MFSLLANILKDYCIVICDVLMCIKLTVCLFSLIVVTHWQKSAPIFSGLPKYFYFFCHLPLPHPCEPRRSLAPNLPENSRAPACLLALPELHGLTHVNFNTPPRHRPFAAFSCITSLRMSCCASGSSGHAIAASFCSAHTRGYISQ